MTAHSGASPQYDVGAVEALILEVAAELHPTNLPARDLAFKVVSDAEDPKEVETAIQAIQGLRDFGLFSARNDELVVPTPAGLRAVALLT